MNEQELVSIYRRSIGPLYASVSRRVGGDRTLAEDIVQEAWTRAVATWPRRGVPDHPLAWLRRVAHNLLASHFRRIRPRPTDPAELDLADERLRPETPAAVALVNWGLARLRRTQAELIAAFHIEGKTVREIADETGLSERAVEGRLRRARKKLHRKLKPFVEPPSGAAGTTTEKAPAAAGGTSAPPIRAGAAREEINDA